MTGRIALRGWTIACAAVLAACLASCEAGSGTSVTAPCKPGAAQPCDCVGGGHGAQFCAADETWKTCDCGITGVDIGGGEPDVAIPGDADVRPDTGCVPATVQARQGCGSDGSVHWFDDCDAEGVLVQACTDAENCAPDGVGGAACRAYCEVHPCRRVEPTDLALCFGIDAPAECTAFPCETDGTPEFCGQDAQYPDNARTFGCLDKYGAGMEPCDESADSGETVVDSLTGLIWQRTVLTEQTWQEAKEYCDGLTYGSHDDWRLPSCAELGGIVRFGAAPPARDVVAFPDAGGIGEFWTSSPVVGGESLAWVVHFGQAGILGKYVAQDRDVRCVRGGDLASDPPSRFAPRADAPEVVVDRATGLQWQGTEFTGKKWKEALRYCEGLTLGDQGDWRLPSVTELRSLVDVTRSGPATAFPAMTVLAPELESDRFWSSTAHPYFRDVDYWGTEFFYNRAWSVDFATGAVVPDPKGNDHRGRCVRAGP